VKKLKPKPDLSRSRLDHPHWLEKVTAVVQLMEGYMTTTELLKLIQRVTGCSEVNSRNVLAAGDGRYFMWRGNKWYGLKPNRRTDVGREEGRME
jgi:hypothetical protein